MKIMKKIGLKLLFPLLFIILSCSNNKPKTVIIDGKEYVAMSIPEDKTNDVLDFDKLAEPYYDDTLYEWDLGCNINEASLEIGTKVEEGDGEIVNCCGLKNQSFFIRQHSLVHHQQKLYPWLQAQDV
ncbi:MAG: hypothetical protein J6Y60_08460 [Treponema sp.]|nr:hypothetical protein [Treponema sp.]